MRAADHLGAEIGQGLLGVESTGLAGQPLHKNLGVFVDENGHLFLFRLGALGPTFMPAAQREVYCPPEAAFGVMMVSWMTKPTSSQ
ncbi:hypothetical protein D3C87_1854910 [compost metagenome]